MKKSTLIQTIGAVIIVILLLVVAFLLGKGSSNTGTEQAAENATKKLIQELGKPVYTNKRKIRENKPSSLLFLTYRD